MSRSTSSESKPAPNAGITARKGPGASESICTRPLDTDQTAFKALKRELQSAFSAPDAAYRQLTAADVVTRNTLSAPNTPPSGRSPSNTP
jgi:hypothetical protein